MSKLSVIVTGRNDDYDGNFDERLAVALSKNMASLPEAEFIFVEWNPIPNKTLSCEKLKKVFGDRVKYYVADPKFHNQYCTIDGFLEYPPKNIGVRKATGDFILCTNSDVVFSPQVTDALKARLDHDTVYRATRVDIDPNYIDIKFPVLAKYKMRINKGVTNACGDFLLLHKDIWHKSTGYCEQFPGQRIHKDSFLVHILVNDYKMKWVDLGMVTHWHHRSSWSELYANRPGIGDPKWDFKICGYEKNVDTWGLTFTQEDNRNGIIWLV